MTISLGRNLTPSSSVETFITTPCRSVITWVVCKQGSSCVLEGAFTSCGYVREAFPYVHCGIKSYRSDLKLFGNYLTLAFSPFFSLLLLSVLYSSISGPIIFPFSFPSSSPTWRSMFWRNVECKKLERQNGERVIVLVREYPEYTIVLLQLKIAFLLSYTSPSNSESSF